MSMSTRISILTQSTCCRVNMQAVTESALPAAGVIDIDIKSAFDSVDRVALCPYSPPTVAKLLGKPDDKVGRCEWERVGCV